MREKIRTIARWSLGVALVGFLAIQFVPYGRAHTNPEVTAEPVWDSPRTRELAVDACFDCHSNTTRWPWYSNIAPMSWVLQRHVDEGRDALNFSRWDLAYEEADEAAETVQEGSMPPWDYRLAHPAARLSDAEKAELAEGLKVTLGSGGD